MTDQVTRKGGYQARRAAQLCQDARFIEYLAEKRPDLDVVPLGQTPLLDAYDAGRHGGTGTPFDWGLVSTNRPYVLAGGLGPDNVAEAVASAAPWGVDASSGLESSPGVKDPARIRAFVEGAKA